MSLAIDLHGRRVLVTGAAGGIGSCIVRILAEAGAAVAACDLESDAVELVVSELKSRGLSVHSLPGDVGVEGLSLPGRAHTMLGGLDGLVNAAGIMKTSPFADVTMNDWDRILQVNLTATFMLIQAAGSVMPSQGGSIVSLSSVAARSGRPNATAYAAAKAGVLSLTKSTAMALAPRVRVNAVCPGLLMTPMWDDIIAERNRLFGQGAGEKYMIEIADRSALGRAGLPEEIANVVAFLLSDLASFVTGQAINVCGGLEMD